MVNPGAFVGSRAEFLKGEKRAYAQAVAGGYARDVLSMISRRYFKRYPVDLPHSEEPTAEHLASVDDEAICPEDTPLDPSNMPVDEYLAEKLCREKAAELVDYRQGQIKHWMAYQYMKDHDINPKETGEHNPYRALLFKLTKKNYKPPRQKTPVNCWCVTHRDEINAIASRTEHPSKEAAAVHDRIARTEFNKLPQEERDEWTQHAKDSHAAALAQYQRDINGPVSTLPEDRQRCIQGLTRFALPILDLIREATGMVASLIVGGPEPAQQGRLQVISIHLGTTTGDVKMNFGRFERSRYKTYLMPTFGNFLKNCYSPDECRARALSISLGFEAMIKFDFEGIDVNVDSVDPEPIVATPASESSVLLASALSVPSTSGLSASSTSTPADTQIEDQASSATAPSIVTEKAANEDKEPEANGVLGGQSNSDDGVLGGLGDGNNGVLEGEGNGGDGVLGRRGDDSDGMDTTPPPSPMFHSIFDLPISPVFREEELVPDSNSPAPTQTPVIDEIPAPIAIVSTTATISAPHASSATPLSSDATTSLSIATTVVSPTAPESSATSLKRKERAEPVLSNSSSHSATKRLWRTGTVVESSNDAPAAVAAKLVKGRRQPSSSAPSASATGELSTLPPLPSNDAAWLKSAITMLTSGSLGDGWINVVDTWVLFERKEINLKPTVLGSSHRPPAVHDWIQRARSASYRPAISSVDRFETLYKLWWALLQPGWRVSASGEVAFAKISGDWSVIHKPGRNGILSVAAALFFWGLKVKDTDDMNGWEMAMGDLLVVLRELLK